MKKVIFFTLASAVLLASCGQQDTSTNSASTSAPIEQAQQELVADNKTVLASNFEVYNEASLGEAENTVLFFHAEWCPTCKTVAANLTESGLPDDTKVLKVDFDTELDLRQKYGVTTQHTFVQVDANGDMIKKWNGSMNAEDVQSQLSGEAMMDKDEAVMEDKMEEDKMMKEDGDAMMEKSEDSEAMMEKEEVMEDKMEAKTEEVAAPTGSLAGTYATYDSSLV